MKFDNWSTGTDLGGLGTSRRRHRLRHVEICRMAVVRALEVQNLVRLGVINHKTELLVITFTAIYVYNPIDNPI